MVVQCIHDWECISMRCYFDKLRWINILDMFSAFLACVPHRDIFVYIFAFVFSSSTMTKDHFLIIFYSTK